MIVNMFSGTKRLRILLKKYISIKSSNEMHMDKRKKTLILGIETSCDDTGCAIVDEEGNILGEALDSQHLIHLNNGGIIPPIAQELHRKNIEDVVKRALEQGNIQMNQVDGIATTIKPGLPLSLLVGSKYGKYLCKKYNKPFIPIHHMEAHALIARMHQNDLKFPFLVLLISGGHCLLAVAKNVEEFLLLGESIDDGVGEAFDKAARRMKLKNLSEFSKMSGGQGIETAAAQANDPIQYKFTPSLQQYKNCMFSMAGLKSQLVRYVERDEKLYNVPPDGLIPDIWNLCASFQLGLTRHLCQRVQRGMVYAKNENLIPYDRQCLVVSGGSACNNFIRKALEIVCDEMEYKLVRPPIKLCTDNGVMIAWNGLERWRQNIGVFNDDEFEKIEIEKSCAFGQSLIEDVQSKMISCKWVKLTKLLNEFKSN